MNKALTDNREAVSVRPWLGYYGDDFTGSTDAMEALTLSGIDTVLFLRPPSRELLRQERFANVKAFGIAGVSRALPADRMREELEPAFAALRESGAAVCHYKVCSTFDSSPQTGSIGRAIELGRELLAPGCFVPLLAGVPQLRRFTIFGHHYAAFEDRIYRLDRHPVMSRHPVTPMDESDLRLHLGRQTALCIGHLDMLELSQPPGDVKRSLDARLAEGSDIVLFDVADEPMLTRIGHLLAREAAQAQGPLFAVGSSGVEYALAAAWREAGLLEETPPAWPALSPSAAPMAVLSGSCSPVTRSQIAYALAHGFGGIRVPTRELLDPVSGRQAEERLIAEAEAVLASGRHVLLYTALGPDDAAIAEVRSGLSAMGQAPADTGQALGERLGRIGSALIRRRGLKRVVVAGGDTSGYVLKELEAYALRMIAPIAPGGPLCRAYSDHPLFDGLELSLKGGQVGREDFFVRASGGASHS